MPVNSQPIFKQPPPRQAAGGGKGYDLGTGKAKDGKGQDKGKGKCKEKDGKGKDKEGDAGDSFRRRMAAQGAWFQRCDGWCERASDSPSPVRCVRPCNEIQDIRFPEHPGPHMCSECAGGEVTVIAASDNEVENQASYRRLRDRNALLGL
jgi:hypothetical protein